MTATAPSVSPATTAAVYVAVAGLERAARRLLDNPGCCDSDCCTAAIRNREAQIGLRRALDEFAAVNP